MPIVINLVATRCLDGDHAMLFRWYNDHVHLLMGCDALQAATLYRRSEVPSADDHDYLCLYEFASRSGFTAFETSDARARAGAVVQAGWARTGLTIVQRTQYERLGRRADALPAQAYRIALLDLGAGAPPDVARWLNDRVHATWGDDPGERAWHRACNATEAGGDALVVTQGASGGTTGLGAAGWQGGAGDTDFGTHPASVQVRWQAAYQRLCRWER